jgi:hypothetical protein
VIRGKILNVKTESGLFAEIIEFCEFCGFQVGSQNLEKRQLASLYFCVCLSVRKEQLGSHWTDLYEV